MEILLSPFKMMGALFLPFPLFAIVPALLFGGLFAVRKKPIFLVSSLLWFAYLVYEYSIYLKLICSGDCNIRVDILLIYPLLLVVTIAASYFALSQKIDEPAIADNENKPKRTTWVIGLWIVASYLILTSGGRLLQQLFIYGAVVPTSKPVAAFGILLLALNMAAGVLLLLHRKAAFYILALSVTLHLLFISYNLFSVEASVRGVSLSQYLYSNTLFISAFIFVFLLHKNRIVWR